MDALFSSLRLPLAQLGARRKRLWLPALFSLLLLLPFSQPLVMGAIADAFWQVSSFVAATLALYKMAEQRWLQAFTQRMGQSPWQQLSFAVVMGALPGCGGAIVVVTQYIQGRISFGAVVAVLTATMGDAAFLLLATKPMDGVTVMLISMGVGVISGALVDWLHPQGIRERQSTLSPAGCRTSESPVWWLQTSDLIWMLVLMLGLAGGLLQALQYDLDSLLNLPAPSAELFGFVAGLAMLWHWALVQAEDDDHAYQHLVADDSQRPQLSQMALVLRDTSFISAWVMAAFVLFEVAIALTGVDLARWFNQAPHWVPLLGVALGLLPGCGPQIIVTSLYIQGSIPFSAQLGNAISNDGDALFPALAIAPRAALLATFYSAIPALAVAYGYYWLWE
ncbi:putative manganese transporter [Balneatrix alpica]|uniref:putative manganese transporter n=1 Tax=Balneatrix alpica TaxID=75684 RepID=UPI002738EA0D|nr:putative manganese transporter [Balneatrix alpica]